MARNTENTEVRVTRNAKRMSAEAENILVTWENSLGVHRRVIITAALLAFKTLDTDVQSAHITNAIGSLQKQ